MLGRKLIVVCSTTAASAASTACSRPPAARRFNNLLDSPHAPRSTSRRTRAASARSPKRAHAGELEAAVARARGAGRTTVIVIDTDPRRSTEAGGWWWDVARARRLRSPPGQRRARRLRGRAAPKRDRHEIRWGVSPIAWANDDMPELGGDTPLESILRDIRDSASKASSWAGSSRASRRS
jgi:3D-(3,5/4)-trihydroxycyclohexane-1,2-dione acylhydrolase (decyclizing)